MGKPKETVTKAYEVSVTENALKNIDEITGYVAFINHEPLAAINIGNRIIDTFDRIAQNPYVFRECEELRTKTKIYRRAVCLAWQIVYRITEDKITILGVIHSSRKPSGIRGLRRIK